MGCGHMGDGEGSGSDEEHSLAGFLVCLFVCGLASGLDV